MVSLRGGLTVTMSPIMPNHATRISAQTALEEWVECSVEDSIGFLTLNHPAKRNALSAALLQALQAGFDTMENHPEVRVVILQAKGAVFSSGHNLKEMQRLDDPERRKLLATCTRVMETARLLSKPVIAQVQGLASAAGCQLVASCDLVVASVKAQFQTPGLKIGLFCSTPMIPLSRVIPQKKALEMLLSAEPVSAEEALAIGLVNRVTSVETLAQETEALARNIAQYSPKTLALGKAAFYRQLPLSMEAAYGVGCETMARNAQSADAQEGMAAFLEKRAPQWGN